jgi:hypothetical protein
MTGDLSGYNQFVRGARRRKRQREKANSQVVQVVQLESPLERLSDCRTVPYLRFFLVRNEEVAGSIPVSSTKLLCFAKAGCSIRLSSESGHGLHPQPQACAFKNFMGRASVSRKGPAALGILFDLLP